MFVPQRIYVRCCFTYIITISYRWNSLLVINDEETVTHRALARSGLLSGVYMTYASISARDGIVSRFARVHRARAFDIGPRGRAGARKGRTRGETGSARVAGLQESCSMPGAVTSSDRNFRTLLPGSKSRSRVYGWASPANIVFYTVLPYGSNVRKCRLFLARAAGSVRRASAAPLRGEASRNRFH